MPGGKVRRSQAEDRPDLTKEKSKREMIKTIRNDFDRKKKKRDIPVNQQSECPPLTPSAPSIPTLLPLHRLRPR